VSHKLSGHSDTAVSTDQTGRELGPSMEQLLAHLFIGVYRSGEWNVCSKLRWLAIAVILRGAPKSVGVSKHSRLLIPFMDMALYDTAICQNLPTAGPSPHQLGIEWRVSSAALIATLPLATFMTHENDRLVEDT